jgi:hypothetical protein
MAHQTPQAQHEKKVQKRRRKCNDWHAGRESNFMPHLRSILAKLMLFFQAQTSGISFSIRSTSPGAARSPFA